MSDRHALARQFLAVVPMLLHRLGSEIRDVDVASGPVTMAQFRAMTTLRQCPRSINELATLHEVSAPAMSRLISTLVERGWVGRERDPEDRRQVVLNATPAGIAIWQEVANRGAEHLAEMLEELEPVELAGLEQALRGLARVAATRRQSVAGRTARLEDSQ